MENPLQRHLVERVLEDIRTTPNATVRRKMLEIMLQLYPTRETRRN